MSTIVQLVQGSAEWHAHRRGLRNASETPAVLGISPWVTPYQLWLLKTGPRRARPSTRRCATARRWSRWRATPTRWRPAT